NPVRGDDPMRTPTTEPQAALLVEETDIPHPMPHRPVRIGNLVRRRRCRVAEVVLADVRAPGDDLTDLTRRQRLDVVDTCDRGFGDRHDPQLDTGKPRTDTQTLTALGTFPRFLQHGRAVDLAQGKRL